MTTAEKENRCREVVYKAALEFADSGVFNGREAVEQPFRSQFDVEYVCRIVSRHVCRLAPDRRCDAARAAGHGRQADPAGESGGNAAANRSVCWPKADPNVVRAMDAPARCG